MNKLKDIIETWIWDGKPPAKKIPQYMVDVLIDIYNGLCTSGMATFLESELLPVLSKCGIKTEAHGVGYAAYIER